MFVDALTTPKAMVYGCGLAGRWLVENFGDRCVGFIDTDEKKSGLVYSGKLFIHRTRQRSFWRKMSQLL